MSNADSGPSEPTANPKGPMLAHNFVREQNKMQTYSQTGNGIELSGHRTPQREVEAPP